MNKQIFNLTIGKTKEYISSNFKVPPTIREYGNALVDACTETHLQSMHNPLDSQREKPEKPCGWQIPLIGCDYFSCADRCLHYHSVQLNLYSATCARGRN